MKLIGVTLIAFWLGICQGTENRYSENPYNGYQENGLRQSGNERSNGGRAPAIGGIPDFVYDAGLRQEGNGLRRQQNGFSQDLSMQSINGQPVDPNSVIDDKNILTQRFRYQEVSNRNEVKESPMTHFQIPGMKQPSQVSSLPSQRNGGFDKTNILPSQQFSQQVREFPQTSMITRFQGSGVRQPDSETKFHPSEMKHLSGSSDFSSTSQQFDVQKSEPQARPSFPPSFESTFETSKNKESSQSVKYDSQNQEKIHSFRQSEEQTRLSQNVPSSVFPPKLSEERRVQGSSEFPSQIRNGALNQIRRQPQQFTAQEEDSRITSDFKPSTTFQIPPPRQPFEKTPEISWTQPQRFESMQGIETKTISQFPQTIDSHTRTQISETRQPLKSTLQDKDHRNQISETQRFGATEVDDRHIFPVEPSVTQFQESGIRQSIEPTRLDSAHEDTQQTHRQTQQFSTQETGVKSQPRFPPVSAPSSFQAQPKPSLFIAPREDVKKTQETEMQKPQFSPPTVPQVPSSHGQISPSQQFVSQETEVKSQSGFLTQEQRFQLQPLPHQETEAKARPQVPPSLLTKSTDTRQPSQVEEKETERQTFQSKETDVRAQTRFQSAPSVFSDTRQPSAAAIQREEAVATTHDQRFPTQQITSTESEKKTSTRFSSPQISHFQAPVMQQQEKPFQPIVRQESLAFPPRFNLNLFRDVGYASPPVHNRPNVALVKYHNIGPTDEGAYAFIFESEDGIIREEQGGYTQPDKGLTAKTGSFSYVSPDGTIVETSYIADERGYRTQSAPLARIDDPNLPAGKYDRYRSALAEKQRNDRKDFIAKAEQEDRTRF